MYYPKLSLLALLSSAIIGIRASKETTPSEGPVATRDTTLATPQRLVARDIPGTTLRYGYASQRDLKLEAVTVLIDGEEITEAHEGDYEESVETAYEVTNEVLEASQGRATELRRTFESLKRTSSYYESAPVGYEAEDWEEELEEESPLEGRSVVFEAHETGFAAALEDEPGDADELLAELEARVNFAWVLPDAEVDVGDSWALAPAFAERLLEPFGDLSFRSEEGGESHAGEFHDSQPDFEGELRATLEAVRSEDETELAEIRIRIEVAQRADTTEDFLESEYDGYAEEEVPEVSSAELTLALAGEAILLWDVGSGRLRSVAAELDVEFTSDLALSIMEEGQAVEYEETSVLVGTHEIELLVQD